MRPISSASVAPVWAARLRTIFTSAASERPYLVKDHLSDYTAKGKHHSPADLHAVRGTRHALQGLLPADAWSVAARGRASCGSPSHLSAYPRNVGTDRWKAARAATRGAQTRISISARRAESQATASSLASKVIGAR